MRLNGAEYTPPPFMDAHAAMYPLFGTYATRLAIHALYFKLQLIFEISSLCFIEIQPILARLHS